MRRLSTLVAALATVFAVGSANALFLSVDDFDTPDDTVFDGLFGGGGVTQTSGPRTITHTLLTNAGNGTGTRSNVTVGNDSFPTGRLQLSNNDQIDSETTVSWSLAAGFVPLAGPVSFLFAIVGADGVPVTISYSLDGVNFTTVGTSSTIVNTPTVLPFAVPLTAGQQSGLNAGGTLTLKFEGDTGYDFSIDSFGFQTPEPTSLALVGLALLGAGVASRRRKA
jgi:hypothetical protein